MPRANRFHIPTVAWHITHRCHDRKFLLRFEQDRSRWRYWLFQAKRRYGLCVLNFIATSNHIHLLVMGASDHRIARSMQLIASRTAQEFNHRKERRGAFWEDRYFATAISTDEHLIRCLVYIDLNMVRAGVVNHPSEWKVCGFNEIQNPRLRYGILDLNKLREITGIQELKDLQTTHLQWLNSKLNSNQTKREPQWTDPVAVGSSEFIQQIKARLGPKAYHRKTGSMESNLHFVKEIDA
jgi:putative transposase